HPCAHGTAADQHDHIACFNWPFAQPLHSSYGSPFARKDTRRAALSIDTIRVDHSRVDGRAFDDRALRGKVAAQKGDRAGESARTGPGGIHDHIIRINSIEGLKLFTKPPAAFTVLPFIQ